MINGIEKINFLQNVGLYQHFVTATVAMVMLLSCWNMKWLNNLYSNFNQINF